METEVAVSLFSQLKLPIMLFFVALILRAVFAFLETSITALRLFKLKEIAAQSFSRYTELFQTLEKHPHEVLITTLIVSSFADVTAGALSTYIVETIFRHFNYSSGLGFTIGIGVATVLIPVFGEIVPKNLARGRSERIFTSMLWLINSVHYILRPLTSVLTRFADWMLILFNQKQPTSGSEWVTSEKEIRFLIDYIHRQGLMESDKSKMLCGVLDLGSVPVKDVMVPATDIVSIPIDTPIKKALRVFSDTNFTRLPVYENTQDNIIGMAHQKDVVLLLSNNEEKPLHELMRPIMFVPDSMKINQLLREFRQKQMHIATVLNEHGILTGLITLEDVLEEIVGEISDEHDPAIEMITELRDGGWLANASIPLEKLEEQFDITFDSQDSVTLGGFLAEQLQHMPQKGERVSYQGYCFQIQKTTARRVQQVLIFRSKPQKTSE